MGGVEAGPGGRAWRGKDAGPGAAVAVTKRAVSRGGAQTAGEHPPEPSPPAWSTHRLAGASPLIKDGNRGTRLVSSTSPLVPPHPGFRTEFLTVHFRA